MKRAYKYIRAFIITFIISSVFSGLLASIKFGVWHGLQFGLLFGIMLCPILALLFFPIDYLYTRKLPPEALQVCQDRDFTVDGDFDQIFQMCIEVLRSYKYIKNVKPQKEMMHIAARTKQSLYSFGENIKLQFSEAAPKKMAVHISSYPIGRYILLDNGKNYKNVEYIIKTLNERLGINK